MVEPGDVPRILLDAARLIRDGRVVVFGSAALAFWLDRPPQTRDIDIWVSPADRGDLVEALMGELSWYHDKHDAYVEVWAPETFAAPSDWWSRARRLHDDTLPGATLVVPHPHDILISKLERWETGDQEHAARILAEYPANARRVEDLVARSPYRDGSVTDSARIAPFEAHLTRLLAMVS